MNKQQRAAEAWEHIEYLLTEECGMHSDEGINQQRSNCINAIVNAIGAEATAREATARAEERETILHDAKHIRKLTVKSDTALETIDSMIAAIRARSAP